MPRPIVLDTDTGVDDALAILLAVRSPEVEVVCITSVSGNIDVDHATANVLRTLDAAAPESRPPVARAARIELVERCGCAPTEATRRRACWAARNARTPAGTHHPARGPPTAPGPLRALATA